MEAALMDVLSEPNHPFTSPKAGSVKVFLRDQNSEAIIRQSLGDLGVQDAQFMSGHAATAIKALAKEKSPLLLIVDVTGLDDPASSLLELAEVCDPDTHVVVIGDKNDIILYRDIKATGVVEYFPKPLVRDLLNGTFNAVLKPQADRSASRMGKLVFMLGVRGGSGATTLSTMASWNLAETRHRRTILLDLALQNGDAALQLDATPDHALCEAFEYPERVDKLYLERATKQITKRLDLLASLEPLSEEIAFQEQAVISLLEKLLNRYRFVVVDLPHTTAMKLTNLLQMPSTCVLVSNASLTAARDVARWRKVLGPNTPERTTLHVLNNTIAHCNLPMAEFTTAAGKAPDVVIPYDRELAAASTLGLAAMRKCENFNRRLHPVIDNFTGACAEKTSSVFSKVFGSKWLASAKE